MLESVVYYGPAHALNSKAPKGQVQRIHLPKTAWNTQNMIETISLSSSRVFSAFSLQTVPFHSHRVICMFHTHPCGMLAYVIVLH